MCFTSPTQVCLRSLYIHILSDDIQLGHLPTPVLIPSREFWAYQFAVCPFYGSWFTLPFSSAWIYSWKMSFIVAPTIYDMYSRLSTRTSMYQCISGITLMNLAVDSPSRLMQNASRPRHHISFPAANWTGHRLSAVWQKWHQPLVNLLFIHLSMASSCFLHAFQGWESPAPNVRSAHCRGFPCPVHYCDLHMS